MVKIIVKIFGGFKNSSYLCKVNPERHKAGGGDPM